MKVKKEIILGAGFGKRMRPITKNIPKPLVEINGVTLLESSIKFLNSLGVKHIIVNAHYLHKEIVNFLKRRRFSPKVNVVVEKRNILDTGGGILNASKKFKKLEKVYLKNKKPTMLLVSKNRSYDRSFKGDFNLNSKNEILRQKNNKFIFTGVQIISRSIFKKKKIKPFSMNKVWDDLIKNKKLLGVASRQKFFHINNYKIYKKLNKKFIG